MTDGVYTIPLLADFRLDDFEPAGQPASDRPHSVQRTNGSPTKTPSATSSAVSRSSPARREAEFVAGPENRLLAEAVRSLLAEIPSPYNPLVLCGPPGTGKTHIAGGLARHWRTHDRHVIYISGADFARSLATAIDNRSTAVWRNRHRDTSLFVLEELTQLSGKRAALEELLHTLDALMRNQSQVVITSRISPDHIAGMPQALAARLFGGLLIQLAPPNPAVRLELVERYAQQRNMTLPRNAARMLADGLAATPPELFGAVTELAVESAVNAGPITPERVRSFLANGHRGVATPPTVRSIATLSAKHFGLKLTDLTSSTRRRAVVQARNIAIYLARQLAGISLQQLGQFFGNRDHTTILHGYRTIETRARTDPTVRQSITELRQMLAQG